MSSSSQISHTGIITDISDDYIEVKIEAKSACSSCHAKSSCHVSDMEEKTVLVEKPKQHTFTKGQGVTVFLSQNKGFEALFFGYLLPFLILFGTLLIASQYTTELRAGITSLLILIPYYIVLFFSKKAMRKRFSFQLERI